MSRRRSDHAEQRAPDSVLVRLYSLLLYLYPARFRREYGAEMVRVLCDRSRDTQGLGRTTWLWRWAFGDLLRSALSEHFGGGAGMSRNAWVAAGGAAAVLGGLLYTVDRAMYASSTLASLVNNAGLWSTSAVAADLLAPLFFIGATVALWQRLGTRGHWLPFSASIVASCGLLTSAVASAMVSSSHNSGAASGHGADNLRIISFLLLVLGFALVDPASIRARLLPLGGALPLALAAMYAVTASRWVVMVPADPYIGYALNRGYAVVDVVTGVLWIILGFSLWRSATHIETTQTERVRVAGA